MRLADKVAIVTGAGSGIGRASAVRFAQEGAQVICADITGAQETAAAIGSAAFGIEADAGREEDVIGLVEAARTRFGGLDIFFANAGISGGLASLFEQSVADWQEILRVNLIGPALAVKHAAPAMRDRGKGSIIIVSSIGGLKASAVIGAYNVSKAADFQLARNLAAEFGPHQVRVNCIAPGLVRTDFARALWENPDTLKAVTAHTP
ncbi:MAG TPA: SDR family NAD(P)-dependent oxidoreductase, partial [Allosphingosinicella sp.]